MSSESLRAAVAQFRAHNDGLEAKESPLERTQRHLSDARKDLDRADARRAVHGFESLALGSLASAVRSLMAAMESRTT